MKIIYLPGFSVKNKVDGEAITSVLKEKGHDVYFHQWKHWEDYSNEFRPSRELEIIDGNIDSNEEFILVGKSIGTHISVKLINHYNPKINKLILMGLPIGVMSDEDKNEYKTVLRTIEIPTFIIQNNKDPYGGEDEAKAFLEGVNKPLIIKEANHHTYTYPEVILNIIEGGFDV